MSSASSTAFLMDSTVASMLTTTPLRSPIEGWVPMPMMLTEPPDTSPTTAQILVVPMSRPTTMSSLRCMLFQPPLGPGLAGRSARTGFTITRPASVRSTRATAAMPGWPLKKARRSVSRRYLAG